MTVDEFEMDPSYSGYHHEMVWKISMRDCNIKTEFKVDDDVMQECIANNFDYISDTAAKEIADRVLNLWDESKITDEQKQNFLDVLRMVIG